jgi:hypothetical protein
MVHKRTSLQQQKPLESQIVHVTNIGVMNYGFTSVFTCPFALSMYGSAALRVHTTFTKHLEAEDKYILLLSKSGLL